MAEDSGQERSLPASARRLEQAREEGQVARSPELATTLVLGGAGLLLASLGGSLFARMEHLLSAGLRLEPRDAFDRLSMSRRLAAMAFEALLAFLPLVGALAIAAILPALLMGGWNFSWKALRFDASRVDPLKGAARLLSAHGAAELGKAVVKAVLLTGAMFWLLWHFREQVAGLGVADVRAEVRSAGHVLLMSFLALVGVMAFLALIDVPLQLWRHYSSLRMTLQELREETRETEGDPHVRLRIRTKQREMARRRMMAEVPRADVVVTNPTHYAVALSYREDRMRAPRVVAKGSGEVALRIRELAAEHGVPRLEAPALARALHRHADLGDEVPAALYTAVAQVLAYVFQLRHAIAAHAVPPQAPERIDVPAGLDPAEGTA